MLLSSLFPSGEYPTGELVPYDNLSRTTDEEIRYNSRLWDADLLHDYRQAAEIHSQARQYAQKHLIKPGATLLSIANGIEETVRALCGHQGAPNFFYLSVRAKAFRSHALTTCSYPLNLNTSFWSSSLPNQVKVLC